MAVVSYHKDDAARRITVDITGPLTAEDLLNVMERQVFDGAWAYALLYTVQEMPPDVAALIRYRRETTTRLGRRGPVAVVARHPAIFRIAREYANAPDDGAEGFFSNHEDAERWLAAQTGAADTE
jgi:hypothetical protein